MNKNSKARFNAAHDAGRHDTKDSGPSARKSKFPKVGRSGPAIALRLGHKKPVRP